MAKNITIDLTEKGLHRVMEEIRAYQRWMESKERELRQRLASLGATVASIQFSRAIYNGSNDVTVRVDDTGSVAVIYAEGKSVAFIEFGSGAKYGYGHPQADALGVGPGTYSDGPDGEGHWDEKDHNGNYKGWWYGRGQHSFGNPPAMAMAKAVEVMTEQITMIAREVFSK